MYGRGSCGPCNPLERVSPPISVSMPPWIYQKHILPKNVPVHVSNLAPTPEMASNAQLLTENQALRQEIQTLDEVLQDSHQEMHDGFDAGNTQILLESFLE